MTVLAGGEGEVLAHHGCEGGVSSPLGAPQARSPRILGFSDCSLTDTSAAVIFVVFVTPFGNLEEMFPRVPQADGVRWEVPKL